MGIENIDPVSQLSLPPGFRFYPTDEELLVHYLCRKVAGHQIALQIIVEIDIYKFDPWDLPSKTTFGEKEWYFFTPRDRKYPNGSRPNRVAGSGYWKATGTDKIITTEGHKVGIKKSLVFYIGKAPKGIKTNWIMHEFRLSEHVRKKGSSHLDDWVLCRIYKKKSSTQKPNFSVSTKEQSNGSSSSSSSHLDDLLESLPQIGDQFFGLPRMSFLKPFEQEEKTQLQNQGSGRFEWSNLTGLDSLPGLVFNGQAQSSRPVNDTFFPSIRAPCPVNSPSEKYGNSAEEEVESRHRQQRVENSGFFQQNTNTNAFAQPFSDSLDPFGIRCPRGFGYQQQ
ncbi:hypothetical protein HHK36_001930 [Tetracentron sinense]|uniref:NAC domain-containing protein n=1 Tax=Tetracentron sinense TaxID=13715 RepID=A0A834ZUI9_TETSI|nr:hypothetical protein HHK36_001930 [Tetracentron sinense]